MLRLLAIDDFVLDEHRMHPADISDRLSDSLGFDISRREGIGSSVAFASRAETAIWDTQVICPDGFPEERDALLTALVSGHHEGRELRLLAERDDPGRERVVTHATVAKIEKPTHLDVLIDFESSDSTWLSQTRTETEKTFTSSLDQAMRITVPGNAPTHPIVRITPLAQRTSKTAAVGWSQRRRFTITNGANEPLFRYPVRIALGSTTATVSGGKALSSGNDVRVWLDGVEQSRTLVTWNTGASYAWVIIPALAAGASITYDIVYGNASAGTPPVLAYPDLPPFTLASSSNTLWVYEYGSGKGIWYLSSGAVGALADWGVPGSWHPALTLDNPNNDDIHAQKRSTTLFIGDGAYRAHFHAYRFAPGNGVVFFETDPEVAPNPYDGVALHNPFGITKVRTGLQMYGVAGTSRLVVIGRNSASEPWQEIFSYDGTTGTGTFTPADYAGASPLKHMAIAVWPANRYAIWPGGSGWAYSHTTFETTINSGALGIAEVGNETEIYELATELRLGGGGASAGVPPYRSLLIGNARSASGAGTPRCAVTLAQAVEIDCEAQTHTVWDAAFTVKAEDVSTHAVRGLVGRDSNGSTVEFRASDWLGLSPPRQRVANGTFDVDIGSWESGGAAAGITATRTHDATIGGAQLGSYKLAITANSSGVIGSYAAAFGSRLFAVNGRDRVEFASYVRSTSVNIEPLLQVLFYNDALDLIGAPTAVTWVPAANTAYRRSYAVRVPAGATQYRLAFNAVALTETATGTVNVDDVTLNDNELVVADVAMGSLKVKTLVRGRWVA